MRGRCATLLLLMTLMGLSTVSPGEQKSSAPAQVRRVDLTYQKLKVLLDVLNFSVENYVEEVDADKLIYAAARGITRELDPFSQFMEPEFYQELKVETEGKFGGLGIRIAIRDDMLTVVTPMPGTPAFRAGILPGDRITHIEGVSTQGITIEEAVKKLRGTPGTKVTITISREGDKEPRDFTITRAEIKIEVIKSKMLDETVGYLAIYEFNANTTDEARQALAALRRKGMRSLVLDLRNNPGGLLDQAVETSKLFIGGGKLIVYTEGRRSPRREYRAGTTAPEVTIPMVTLVNGGSASGAEILAGALQDNKRSLIVGSRTFGKASVQSVVQLDGGCGLKLTTAHYYTPSGRLIHRVERQNVRTSTATATWGIAPDVTVEVSRDTEAKLYMQRDEVHALGKEPAPSVKPEDRVRDEALDRAVEILRAVSVMCPVPEAAK